MTKTTQLGLMPRKSGRLVGAGAMNCQGRFGRSFQARSGTVMIVVVVMLTLMILLGAAYIQIARLDRQAGQETGGNIDAVVDASIEQIKSVLARDLYNGNGAFFASPANPASPTAAEISAGSLIEPYDYPWTNTNTGVFATVGAVNPVGGSADDTWLASTATTGGNTWPHLSNLTGMFLRNVGQAAAPTEQAITNSGGNAYDTNVTIDSTATSEQTDADKDGINDSRWIWAPIRQINDVQYVMAVRIIDNSAMINVNTALSQIDASGAYSTSNATAVEAAPRWWYPSELDLGKFVRDRRSGSMGELDTLLQYRLNHAGSKLPTHWYISSANPGVRSWFWLKGPRLYNRFNQSIGGTEPTTTYRNLAASDTNERDLRYHNGLNDPLTTSELKTRMPTFLRGAAAESSYSTVDLTLYGGTNGNIQDFFDREPRKQMTTFSGASVLAPRATSEMTTVGRTLKQDLNYLAITRGRTETPRYGTLQTTIRNLFSASNYLSTIPGVFTIGAYAANPRTRDTLADQLAASIATYVRTDNKLAKVVDPADPSNPQKFRYGMAPLPFISEIYVQRQYQAQLITPGSPTPGVNDTVTWTQQGNIGYAIEIRNPFRRVISLQNVQLQVNNNVWGTLSALSGQTILNMDEGIILYRNSTSSGGTNDNLTTLMNTSGGIPAGPSNQIDISSQNKAWPTSEGPVTVTLLVMDEADSSNTYTIKYQKVPSIGMADTFTRQASPVAVIAGERRYRQYSSVGNGDRINIMLVRETTTPAFRQNDNATFYTGPLASYVYSTDKSALGQVNKTGAGGPANYMNPNLFQVVTSTEGAFRHVGELTHIIMAGPDATMTIPDAFNGNTQLTPFMLNFSSSEMMGAGNLNVPHAQFFLERFTTLSPRNDNLDNDGIRGIDNEEEQLVPGTININTATAAMLNSILPIPDDTIRANVVNNIVNYRANPASRSGTLKGLAYMGELYPRLALTGTNGKPVIGSTYVDFLGPTDSTGAVLLNTPGDGLSGDRKQVAMISRFLQQVASTRSDFYTAYVLIRGYQVGNFSADPVETARYFVVLDRSAVTSRNDSVRVVVFQRLE